MTSLSTSDAGGLSEQQRKDELLTAFISVLDCSSQDAGFFLEASLWNIEEAVVLYLDRLERPRVATQSGYKAPPKKTYAGRVVVIEGLPLGWTARVSRSTGQVVFLHSESQFEQFQVPPGFADDADGKSSSNGAGNGMSFSDGYEKQQQFYQQPQQQQQQQPQETFGAMASAEQGNEGDHEIGSGDQYENDDEGEAHLALLLQQHADQLQQGSKVEVENDAAGMDEL